MSNKKAPSGNKKAIFDNNSTPKKRGRPPKNKSFNTPVGDGFSNVIAKLGATEPNVLSGTYYNRASRRTTWHWQQLNNLYRSSWVVAAGIDNIAEDMTREGVDFVTSWSPEEKSLFNEYCQTTGTWKKLCTGIKWGNLYGGAIGVMIIDGQDWSTPLDLDTIQQGDYKGLRIYDRWQCIPSTEQLIDEFTPNEGLPEYYDVWYQADLPRTRIHHSRVLRFIGTELPYYDAIAELFWGASVVERWFDVLSYFDNATAGSANLIQRAHLRVLKFEQFREILAMGGVAEQNFIDMLLKVRYFEQNEGITLMDMTDEYQTHSWSFTSIREALYAYGEQLAGALGQPLVRLFGVSPHGLNSTGESDLTNYYDNILTRQNSDLRPLLNRLFPVMVKSCFGTELPDQFAFTFISLWKMDENEKSTIASRDIDSINKAHQDGLIKRSTALKELKSKSDITGRFTQITEEDIEEAELEEVAPVYNPEEDLQEEIEQSELIQSISDSKPFKYKVKKHRFKMYG